jgi:hypothetical protein
MLGLCLAAVFVVAAVGATSASALPEFGQCFEKEGGKYTEAGCVKKATTKVPGKFEFRKATEVANKKFSGEAGAGVLEGIYIECSPGFKRAKCNPPEEEHVFLGGPVKIECESESNHGEETGTKEVKNISVIFRGCKALGTIPCQNAPKEGEIQVNPLKGKLGFINKNAKPREVGQLLEPAKAKGEFAKFTCSTIIGTVVGMGNEKEGCAYPLKACGGDGIISTIAPVNTMTSELTQVFTINEATAENVPSKFEGASPLKVLESYIFDVEKPEESTLWSKSGETITNVTHSEEPTEIKAN